MVARTIQVTLGAGATQISVTAAPFNQMIVQNNGSAARLGDSTVTSTKGIALAASNAVNSTVSIGPFAGQQGDASQFYLFGTNAQVIDVLLV
jgi:hypothetical protein